MSSQQLKKTLTPTMLWGLGVGYVISGNYFGWNLGLVEGGTLGLAIAVGFIIVLAVTFTFSYTELACAIPRAGGVFDYSTRAFGRDIGFVGGMAQNVEFVFAPPAIAFAIGAYLNLYFPGIPVMAIAIGAYVVFTGLNICGVRIAAMFELLVTAVAVGGLLLFAGVTLPHFQLEKASVDALPNGWAGIFAAIPFAFWFFLAIEGVANVAEETINPQRTILLGFGSAIFTLVVLCLLTFGGAVGIEGWPAVVFTIDGNVSDSPLPLAMALVVGYDHWLYNLFIGIGLFGLVASFHGIILAAGRSTFEFGRLKYASPALGKIHRRFQTPSNALLANMVVGIIALLTGKTAEIITLSVFGALTLYIVAMLTVLRLRNAEPDMPRPFRVPFYPYFPMTALVIAIVAFVALTVNNGQLALIYFLIMGICYALFKLGQAKGLASR